MRKWESGKVGKKTSNLLSLLLTCSLSHLHTCYLLHTCTLSHLLLLCPLSPYAISKLAGENYCKNFYEIYGLETVRLRYFNFGPRQDPTSQYSAVIPKFINAMLNESCPAIYGDGKQSRDFTYVANVVQANLLACKADGVAGELFNVACGERYTVLDLVAELNKILDKDVEPVFTEPRKGDVKHSMADVSKAQRVLGYNPIVDFSSGLRKPIR